MSWSQQMQSYKRRPVLGLETKEPPAVGASNGLKLLRKP